MRKRWLLGSCSPVTRPEVRCRTLDLRPWMPWLLPVPRGSRGREALAIGKKERETQCSIRGGDRQRSPRYRERCVVGIFSRYLEAAAEQSL